MSLGWRDVARKLRGAPPELLASFGIKDGASDSELMKTILTELPDFKDAAGLDTSDLDADIEQWQKIRKDTAASKVLQNDAWWAKRRFQVADETFSLPVNEVLRQTGVIGEEETAGDAAGRAAGGGIGDEAWAEQVVQPAGDIDFGTAHEGHWQPVAQASNNVKQANR